MSLWKIHNTICQVSSPRHTRLQNTNSQGTSLCTCHKGSLTIEATIVIPLTAGFLACILFLFRILQVQTQVEEALIYTGRELAVESSIATSETTLLLSAEGLLLFALTENPHIERYVTNGVLGISLLESDFSGDTILLRASYGIKMPVAFFGLDQIEVSCQNCFRKWTGDASSGNEDGEWVFITPTGTVYHLTTSCQALDLSVQEVSKMDIENYRGANGQKYYSCSICGDIDYGVENVYCTDYGTVYHNNLLCRALTRTIEKVRISEVGERGLCSFCGS